MHFLHLRASLVAQSVKNLPAVQETQVRSLGWEDPLEKEMATHSSILAWKISWTEEPGGLQSMGSQRVGHDWATNTQTYSTLQMRSLWSIHYIMVKISMRTISSQPVSKGGVYFLTPYQQAWESDFLWSVKCKQKWHRTFFPSKSLKSHHEILPSLFSLYYDIMISHIETVRQSWSPNERGM